VFWASVAGQTQLQHFFSKQNTGLTALTNQLILGRDIHGLTITATLTKTFEQHAHNLSNLISGDRH